MVAHADNSAPAPHIVGNAFVEQYYNLLYQAPEEVHKFYQEVSALSRPGPDGSMISVTSTKAINDHILSSDRRSAKVQILTADSQDSYKNGVIVLVTGFLTEKDNLRRKFTQSFFLAPQEKGYFVLNDVFRYVDEQESVDLAVNDVDETAPVAPLIPTPEPTSVPDQPVPNQATDKFVEDIDSGKESLQTVTNGDIAPSERKVVASQTTAHPVSEAAASKTLLDAPKKSFASVVQSLAENTAPFNVRISPAKPVEQSRARAVPAVPVVPAALVVPEASLPAGNNSSEENDDQSVNGTSIFVANLPMNATDVQLHEFFRRYGTIKHDGVQVRSYKQRGNCFGFVEFESSSSVQSVLQAFQACPFMIGERKVSIEVKRVNNDGGKFPSSRGGYRNDNGHRNDNFKGRVNSDGSRNYSRNEYDKRRDFSSQARTNTRHDEVNQNAGRIVASQPQGAK